jgi:hypothetical protein
VTPAGADAARRRFPEPLLLLSLAVALALRAPHLDFVPLWDGRQYFDECVEPAFGPPFRPLALNCFGHPSIVYMLLATSLQWFDFGNPVLLQIPALLLSLSAIVAFHRIVRSIFGERNAAERGLVTLAFSSLPGWTAVSVSFTPDFGVFVGFLWVFALLLERRVLAASFAGVFLALSKEMGLLLFLVLAGIAGAERLLEVRRERRGSGPLLRLAPLALPPAAYFLNRFALAATGGPTSWAPQARGPSLLAVFLRFDFTDAAYGAYMADLFVQSFLWIPASVLLGWMLLVVVRVLRRREIGLPPELDRRASGFALAVALAALYVLTRYPTYNNLRYVLPGLPVVLLASAVALRCVVGSPGARKAGLALFTGLSLLSCVRTVDPVSLHLFGRFRFGRHDLLAMTALTGECCGFGRDQLTYNLEFTRFGTLQDELWPRLLPDRHVVGANHQADWYLFGRLDEATLRRTLRKEGSFRLLPATVLNLAGKPLPERIRYVVSPNMREADDLSVIASAYVLERRWGVEEDGYSFEVLDLRRGDVPGITAPPLPGMRQPGIRPSPR